MQLLQQPHLHFPNNAQATQMPGQRATLGMVPQVVPPVLVRGTGCPQAQWTAHRQVSMPQVEAPAQAVEHMRNPAVAGQNNVLIMGQPPVCQRPLKHPTVYNSGIETSVHEMSKHNLQVYNSGIETSVHEMNKHNLQHHNLASSTNSVIGTPAGIMSLTSNTTVNNVVGTGAYAAKVIAKTPVPTGEITKIDPLGSSMVYVDRGETTKTDPLGASMVYVDRGETTKTDPLGASMVYLEGGESTKTDPLGASYVHVDRAPEPETVGCSHLELQGLQPTMGRVTPRTTERSYDLDPGVAAVAAEMPQLNRGQSIRQPRISRCMEPPQGLPEAALVPGTTLQECEDRLATCARARRRQKSAYEIAERSTREAETVAETAERTLASLEEQERKCRAEQSCVAACSSNSMRQNLEAKLRLLEQKREAAVENLRSARESLDAERQIEKMAREQLRRGSHVAMAAVEAVAASRHAVQQSGKEGHNGDALSGTRNGMPSGSATPPPSPSSKHRTLVARQSSVSSEIDRTRRTAYGSRPSVFSAASPSAAVTRGPRSARLSSSIHMQKTSTRSKSPPTVAHPPRASRASVGASRSGESAVHKIHTDNHNNGRSAHRLNESIHPTRAPAESPRYAGNKAGREAPSDDHTSELRPEDSLSASHAGGVSSVPMAGLVDEMNRDIMSRALEAMQAAEVLQEKLAAMPEHLRHSFMKHCAERCGMTDIQVTERPSITESDGHSAA